MNTKIQDIPYNVFLLRLVLLLLFSLFFISNNAIGQKQVLDRRMHHLRRGVNPEWTEFSRNAEDSQLVIHFTGKKNIDAATIYLRQYDVSQAWQVLLNGRNLGTLTIDEKDMMAYFIIPPASLLSDDNVLIIGSTYTITDSTAQVSDDIRVGQITLEERSVESVLSEAAIDIEIFESKSKKTIPARISVVNMKGAFQQLHYNPDDHIAVRTGVIYTGNGKASFGLPRGKYKLYASHGFEYGVDSVLLDLKPGDHIQRKLVIRREVNTAGWVSCDTHIHTLTHSGHGDATVKERVLTIAGEGIEVPVITEHNAAIGIREEAEGMRMDSFFTPITGDEVTTSIGHFNIFPVFSTTPVPEYRSKDWNVLSRDIRATAGVEAVILNHARDLHNGFRPFDPKNHIAVAGMTLTGWTFPGNAMEVINSGSQQTDPMQLYFDWFGMMNRGYFLTPAGSSDSHDVSRFIVGQGRTYIRSKEDDPARIDMPEVIRNFVNGKVMVSFGLLTSIVVNEKYGPGDLVPASDKVVVSVNVSGPGWMQADHITLYANGQKIREAAIIKRTKGSVKWKGTWVLQRPPHDIFLVAIADGPGMSTPFWTIAKPFQHTSPKWKPLVIGSTGGVWIDADSDGQRSCAHDYARSLWLSTGDIQLFVKKLSGYDESVAVQAAAVLTENGVDVQGEAVSKALQIASAKTRSGFQRFINGLKASKVPE